MAMFFSPESPFVYKLHQEITLVHKDNLVCDPDPHRDLKKRKLVQQTLQNTLTNINKGYTEKCSNLKKLIGNFCSTGTTSIFPDFSLSTQEDPAEFLTKLMALMNFYPTETQPFIQTKYAKNQPITTHRDPMATDFRLRVPEKVSMVSIPSIDTYKIIRGKKYQVPIFKYFEPNTFPGNNYKKIPQRYFTRCFLAYDKEFNPLEKSNDRSYNPQFYRPIVEILYSQCFVLHINRIITSPTGKQTIDKTSVNVSPLIKPSKNLNCLSLCAIILHKGPSPKSGHYTAFLKCNNKWHFYDDLNAHHSIVEVTHTSGTTVIFNDWNSAKNGTLFFYY